MTDSSKKKDLTKPIDKSGKENVSEADAVLKNNFETRYNCRFEDFLEQNLSTHPNQIQVGESILEKIDDPIYLSIEIPIGSVEFFDSFLILNKISQLDVNSFLKMVNGS